MNSLQKRLAGLMACLMGSVVSAVSHAQVLDTPQFYSLPALEGISVEGSPITMNAGDIDPSITSNIANLPLNDIVILGSSKNILSAGASGPDKLGRIWTLVHTSGDDTQSLQLASPVDLPLFSSVPEECYGTPSSVQILDLDGDDTNDLSFISKCPDFFSNPGDIFGVKGNPQDPFQAENSLTVLGSQTDASLYLPQFLGSQPALASGDYDGDGQTDLGFYDYNDSIDPLNPVDQIHALLNDGLLSLLPNVVSNLQGPVIPAKVSLGSLVESGDFDGNGTQDMAIAYILPDQPSENVFKVYSGNGDGSFNPEPLLQVNLGDGPFEPQGLTAANFDGDSFSDFAISIHNRSLNSSTLAILQCSAGSPSASCNVSTISNPEPNFFFQVLDKGDFNGDGLDDLVNIYSNVNIDNIVINLKAIVQLRLNQGGSFANVDQSFKLDVADSSFDTVNHLVVKDIDACGGPDLAYTGVALQLINNGNGPITPELLLQAAVAFNPNEAPIANAGEPTQVTGGVQVGGTTSNPTCSDLTDDVMEISWVVTSGDATISDSSAANPIISNSVQDTVLEVTCTDPCGLSASASVTVPATGFIQGSCTSLTGVASVPFNLTWLMIPAALGFMGAIRRKKS